MPLPFSPPIEYFAQRSGRAPARPFSSPTAGPPPPGGEDENVISGFFGSTISSIPELFGAPPTPEAEDFRARNPISGFISSMAGMAVPYLGAERVAELPSIAPKLASGVESVLGRFGMTAVENPIAAGITRELIVNAPVEAGRLAVGATVYPDNTDLWSDVALNYALTGGIGGLAGWFRSGGKILNKAGQVEGADIFMAPTHQLKMVLDGGAEINGLSKEEFIPKLREQILTETPGVGGASKKPLDYVLPLEGMTAEESRGISSLFEVGSQRAEVSEGEKAPLTGLVKQQLVEGRGKNQLKAGEQATLVKMLPDSFQTIDDVAKTVQFPRRLTVADAAGARQFAGIMSKPGWRPVSDRLSLIQERDGGFVFSYKIADGEGRALGKGAGRTKVGTQYLIGKTVDPGAFDPKAKQLADMITARWAKWGAAFAPTRYDDAFSQSADVMMRAMSVVDYHNLKSLPEAEWKKGFASKLGRMMAKEDGLLDTKLGFKDSQVIRNLTDQAYATFKPTEFLQRQNPVYGRFFGLMRNGMRTADEFTSKIMRGAAELKPGATMGQQIRGKGVKYVSGFENHRPVNQILDDLTDNEVNTMAHLSGTDKLGDDGLEELVGDGTFSRQAADAIKELRAINEDVIGKLVMPVFKETGHDVKWLENHLGIPRVNRGDLFFAVKDADTGVTKHLAFGKTGAAAMREAKLVVESARDAGKNWKIEAAKPQHIAAESEDALGQLATQVFQNVQKTPEEGEVIYRAMKRLGTIKATSGRNPAIPVSSGMFKDRTAISTSAKLQRYSKQEVLNSMEGHMKQLLHFAAMQSWKERFGSVAGHMLQKQNPTLYGDLIRKGNQMLGIEGKITNILNDTLRPIFGGSLGAKPATRIASAVNSYMANANIFWLNPTFAILNLLTPLQTVAPWIAHMRMASEADLAKTMFMQLTPTVDRKGLPNGISAFTDPFKILGQAVQLMKAPPEELRQAFKRAIDEGALHQQSFEEWVGTHTRSQQTLREAYREGGMASMVKQMAQWPADTSEKFSRLIAFNSGYLVGKNYFNLEGDALYRFMRRSVEVTQYNYSTIDRSRIFTGPVGSMLGLFKNWQLHFMGNMMQYAGLALRGENFAPLTWTVGSALALGGLGATPLINIANGLANWHEKGSNGFLWTQKNFDPAVGDAIYFGLPAFLGVSLQSSAAIPGTDVRNETASLFSFATWERAKRLGKAINDAETVSDATGYNGFRDPNVQDELWSAIMPRFMTKLFSSVEGDYVRSMSTGSPQVREVSPVNKMLVAAGFNPVEVEQWQVAGRLMYKEQDARQNLVNGLGRAYADALLNKDGEEAQRVIHRAVIAGELDSVMKSAQTRMNREQTGDVLSRYAADRQGVYRSALQPR